jgi:hypothetical protein
MPDQASRLDENTLERMLSWTRLFRGVGAAIDAKKLILAVLGLLLFHAGREGLDRLFSRSDAILLHPWPSPGGGASPVPPRLLEPAGPGFPVDRASVWADLSAASWRLTEPVRYLVGPFLALFALGEGWSTFFHALLAAVWGAFVWGIFGGAIARIAVVGMARTERIGIGEAQRFVRRKCLALAGTPLCPLLGVAFFAAFCAAFGLLYRLPAVGSTVAGVFAVLPLLAGLVMTIILVSLALGWPLMHATIAAEGEDGFDALSRSFAYVNQRPLRYLSCTALAWFLGILGLIVVDLFARMTVHMAQWGLAFSAPGDLLVTLFQGGPAAAVPTARAVHTFWLSLVGLVAHGWIYSYFWTSAVIVYLILRHDVDGTPWHVIAPPERRAFEFEIEPSPEGPGDSGSPMRPESTAPTATAATDAPARS